MADRTSPKPAPPMGYSGPLAGCPIFHDLDRIPERLDHEPPRPVASAAQVAGTVVQQLVGLAVLAAILPPFWLVYLPVLLVRGRPPHQPAAAQLGRYLRRAWTERPPPPGLAFSARLRLTLELLRIALCAPIGGLAWYLDELLYGRALAATPVVAPVFELSAARSGSTQLGRYLEEDPHLAAPSVLQAMFPYLWLWRLAPVTLGRLMTPEKVRAKAESMLSPAFVQRHEGDPFRTDTLELAFYFHHLNALGRLLGPATMREDFCFGRCFPTNERLWSDDFPRFVDALGRKTLLHAGPGPDRRPRRLWMKGHFLAGADALERRYPDARFLTVVREPLARIRSAINFLAVGPDLLSFGSPPFSWSTEALVLAEIDYCDLEQAWFTRPPEVGARRCVVRFKDYVRDLEGTMRRVYRECLDLDELPPHVPRVHAPRVRTNYLVDRSLAELGVDEEALGQRLAGYRAWAESSAATQPQQATARATLQSP